MIEREWKRGKVSVYLRTERPSREFDLKFALYHDGITAGFELGFLWASIAVWANVHPPGCCVWEDGTDVSNEAEMDAAIVQAEKDLGCADLPQPHTHPQQVKAR